MWRGESEITETQFSKNMPNNTEYKYDVAFSLTDDCKEIARQLNDLLKNKLKTYVYFENIPVTVGQPGIAFFMQVFGSDSRMIVVLISEDWGKTNFTRIEDQAIRDRIVKNGWDFILLVKLQDQVRIPDWYPKENIWIAYDGNNIEAIASVIEYKVKELGGKVTEESLIAKAERIEARDNKQAEIDSLLNSEHKGIELANAEIKELFSVVEGKVQDLKSSIPSKYFQFEKSNDRIKVTNISYLLIFHWHPRSANFLEGSKLDVVLKKKKRGELMIDTVYQDLNKQSYEFTINLSDMKGWKDKKTFNSSEKLADLWLEKMLE